jgi:signal peptidase I
VGEFWKQSLKLLLFLVIVGAVLVGVLRAFFVDVATVAHNGMAPTMVLGDEVLVWRGASLERNDIAVCRHPQQTGRWVIGRIAAISGGEIGMSPRGGLLVGGRAPQRDIRGENVPWLDSETGRTARMRWGIEKFSDYEEHYFFERVDRAFTIRDYAAVRGFFLLSDNRAHVGEDSRTFGAVQPQDCIGQVFMRLSASDTELPDGIPHRALDLLD